ncbi:MAG TPA: hypothetical protein VGG48_06470 [Rhizomicrobium sp.]
MKRIAFALAAGAAFFAIQPAQAAISLGAAQCINKNIAPADRVKYCKSYQQDGIPNRNEQRVADFALALAYRLSGDLPNAEAEATIVVKEDPNWVNAWMERSTTYAEDGKLDLALADVEQLNTVNKDPALPDMQRCWVRAVAGKELDAALADCNKALAVYPDSFAALLARALVNFKRGDMAASTADCTAALVTKPKIAAALYLRGVIQHNADDIDAAKRLEPYIADEFAGYGVKPVDGDAK